MSGCGVVFICCQMSMGMMLALMGMVIGGVIRVTVGLVLIRLERVGLW